MHKSRLPFWLAILLSLTALGCGPKTLVNPTFRHKLKRGRDKLLIMPVVFHGFPSKMQSDLETRTFVRFFTFFSRYGYSVQPLQRSFDAAGFGNLPYRLAMGMFRVASVHGSPHLSKYQDPAWLGPMLASARKFSNWAPYALRVGGLKIPADDKFPYILTAAVTRVGPAGGTSIRYRVIGGIVDVRSQEIVCAMWYERSSKLDKDAIVDDLQDLAKRLKKALAPVFVKEPPPKKKPTPSSPK